MEVGARTVAGFVVAAMVEVGAEAAGTGAVESAEQARAGVNKVAVETAEMKVVAWAAVEKV